MKFSELKEELDQLKKREGHLISNVVGLNLKEDEEVTVFNNEKGIAFIVNEPLRQRGYYSVTDYSELIRLLQQHPSGVVIEYLHKEETIDEMETWFQKGGFAFYKRYIRSTVLYKKNPYSIPETGRRKLLTELYDPNCKEFPQLSDVQELYELTLDTFDPLTDDIPTVERWKKIIENKECVIYREEEKIICYYMYRLEGKKLYSNIALNQGGANWLYNLERSTFEFFWNEGVRVFYAWIDEENEKARRRYNKRIKEAIERETFLYNSIFIKK